MSCPGRLDLETSHGKLGAVGTKRGIKRALELTLLGGLAGCQGARTVDLRSGEPWASAIALYATKDGSGAVAAKLGSNTALLEIPDDAVSSGEAFVLFYDLPLEALLLQPGPMTRVNNDLGRHLPIPGLARRASDEGDTASNDVTGSLTSLQTFREFLIPAPSPESCAAASGCYPREVGECVIPCQADVRPQAPEAAVLPGFDCAHWPRAPASTLGVSSPAVAALEICAPGPIASCAPGQSFVPGVGCRQVMAPCSEWPLEELPADAVYVRAGSVAGDGSRLHPFSSLGAALRAAVPGRVEVVALGPGTLDEDVVIEQSVVVRGCGTTLAGRIHFNTGRSELHDVRLAPGTPIVVAAPAEATLSRVIADGSAMASADELLAVRGRARLVDALIAPASGWIGVHQQASLQVERTQMSNATAAIWTEPRSTLEVRDVAISGTPMRGRPLMIISGEARIEGALIELAPGETTVAFAAVGTASVTLERVSIRARDSTAASLVVQDTARVDARSLTLIGGANAVVSFDSARVALFDTVVTANADVALLATAHSVIAPTRVVIADSRGSALVTSNEGRFELADLFISGSQGGIFIGDRGTIQASRVRIEEIAVYGIAIDTPNLGPGGVENTLTDLSLTNAGLQSIVTLNTRFLTTPGEEKFTRLSIQRAHVSRGHGVGLWANAHTSIRASDVVVEGIEEGDEQACRQSSANFGLVVCVGEGAHFGSGSTGSLSAFTLRGSVRGLLVASPVVTISRGIVEDNELGVVVTEPSIKLETILDEVALRRNTRPIALGITE